MDQAEQLRKRGEDLQARIEAARKHVAADKTMEWAEIGNILESFSREIEESHQAPHVDRHEVLERVEQGLAPVEHRIAGAR